MYDKLTTANRQIKSVTYIAVTGNIALSVVKVLVGLWSGSMALVADGAHSISDMVTDLAVLVGVYIGAKKPDEKHQYGHGKAETLAAAFIGVILAVVGALIVTRAAADIAAKKRVAPHFGVLVVAALSIVVKELLYRITRKVARRLHSTALYANAWHHRSDALSSIAVVAGFIALKLSFQRGDQLAAAAVGLMIILVAVHILSDCFNELTDAAVDDDIIGHIKKIINADGSIRSFHRLRTRTVGREVFVDLHILVDPALSIADAHEISEQLENALHKRIVRPVNIVVHVEPDIPELRK